MKTYEILKRDGVVGCLVHQTGKKLVSVLPISGRYAFKFDVDFTAGGVQELSNSILRNYFLTPRSLHDYNRWFSYYIQKRIGLKKLREEKRLANFDFCKITEKQIGKWIEQQKIQEVVEKLEGR
jgi:hypothetical protein